MWISNAIGKGLTLPSHAAHHSGGPEAAMEWLHANYKIIPEDLRPSKQAIEEFAAFFSTYLTSSFDVIQKPGTEGTGPIPRFACTCDLCVRIANAPHLQAKKLYARDKRRADFLMTECIQNFAAKHEIELDDNSASNLIIDQGTRRAAAFVTYGHWLILRLKGESDGPAILALWRLIAWDPRGGTRQGFTLRLEDFKTAESTLLSAIQDGK